MIAVLLGSTGMSASADFQKGLTAYKSGDFATARRIWEPLAQKGDVNALFRLGKLLLSNNLKEKGKEQTNKAVGLHYIGEAAKRGHPDALYILATFYRNGTWPFKKDIVKARDYFFRAAKNGHSFSQFLVGVFLHQSKNYDSAMEMLNSAHRGGEIKATVFLSDIYFKGLGVQKDVKRAFDYLIIAAENGDSLAQTQLGFFYANGIGTDRDLVKALMWNTVSYENNRSKHALDNSQNYTKYMKLAQIEEARVLAEKCIRRKYKDC